MKFVIVTCDERMEIRSFIVLRSLTPAQSSRDLGLYWLGFPVSEISHRGKKSNLSKSSQSVSSCNGPNVLSFLVLSLVSRMFLAVRSEQQREE